MITDEQIAIGETLESIFMPLAHEKKRKIRSKHLSFVHYTSADVAKRIIVSREIWMRNARCMNDYSEASFGYQQLVRIFKNPGLKDDFITALSPFGNDIGNQILKRLNDWWGNIQNNTYITCISEHDPSENTHGRLSMWRAYGGSSAKAALVLRMPLEPGVVSGLHLLFSPVEYFTDEETEAEFRKMLKNIRDNEEILAKIDPTVVLNAAFFVLVLIALCLKHKGFSEEKEWRVICLPYVLPSENLTHDVEVVGGVPQIVYKIPLQNNAEKQIQRVSVPDLIERVIIGPSMYPGVIHAAFLRVLETAGIPEPRSRLAVSDIPLRT